LSVRSAASARAILVIAVVGVVVIASEQTWRTALFATVIATVIAATRVRFALHVAAALLVVLAVLAAAGAGVGAGHPVRARSRPAGHVLTRAARPAPGRAGSTRAPRHHRAARGR
jgi:glucose-6-phosphate-specific signal transduction histidine kinase